jgi:hypothetical protein
MPEKRSIGRIIIDNYLIGIIFAVLYLCLIAVSFVVVFGNPTDPSMRVLDILEITSFTDDILINLAIWFAVGTLINMVLKKIRNYSP